VQKKSSLEFGTVSVGELILTPQKAVLMGKVAIIADLHLGIEQSMPGSIPRLQIGEIVKDIQKIFELYGVKRLIIAGDMKHEFSKNLPYEWDDVEFFVEKLRSKFGDEVIEVVRGNHDNYLATILAKYNISLPDYAIVDGWAVTHGHSQITASKIIMGHEHPSIKIRASSYTYTFPCYLRAKNEEREIIVLPAFSPMVSGSDTISSDSFLSPLLNGFDFGEIEVYAVEDRVYFLGNLKNLREFLVR
jgi:hypothetical protein